MDDDGGDEGEESTLVIYSWWINPGEVEALEALVDLHVERHPNVTVINAVTETPNTAQEDLARRLEEGNPPDTFQDTLGAVIPRHVELNGVDDANSRLAPLDDLAGDVDLSAFPEEILDTVSSNGHLYAMPLNIHRLNNLFYNMHVLDDNGLTVPTTIAELEATCETLAQSQIACLSVGGVNHWPLGVLFSEAIMSAMGGAEWFNDFYQGRADINDPLIVEAAETLVRLTAYMPANELDIDWVDSGTLAAQGEVAFTVMGDWMKGYLTAIGSEPGVDFSVAPFPGSSDVFVFLGDCFPLPQQAANPEGARDFLITMGDKDVQTTFNRIKGSTPARADISADEFDVVSAQTVRDFQTVDKAIFSDGQANPGWDPPIYEAVAAQDAQILVSWIKNNYGILQR